MERRQDGGQRRKIVQEYIRSIDNDQERTVCYLFMNNYDEYEIRKCLRITRKQLNRIKTAIREKLIAAGIQTAEV